MSTPQEEHLVGLLMMHQEQIFRYIFSLLPHDSDARDVLQETCIALYRKADEYDPDRPFLPWAYGFATRHVLKHHERADRRSILLSPDTIALLAQQRPAQEDTLRRQLQALDACVEKLPDHDRRLIDLRYQAGKKADQLVQELDMSRRTVFRELRRIRGVLLRCMSQHLTHGGDASQA